MKGEDPSFTPLSFSFFLILLLQPNNLFDRQFMITFASLEKKKDSQVSPCLGISSCYSSGWWGVPQPSPPISGQLTAHQPICSNRVISSSTKTQFIIRGVYFFCHTVACVHPYHCFLTILFYYCSDSTLNSRDFMNSLMGQSTKY